MTPPKRQKDRVAELEAQVEALTKLLESQKIQTPSTDSPSSSQGLESQESTQGNGAATCNDAILDHSRNAPQKKRRLEDEPLTSDEYESPSSHSQAVGLDAVVSQDMQRNVFEKYVDEIMPACPLVPIADGVDYDALRQTRPLLLQAIVYAASPGVLESDLQEDIAMAVMNLFASVIEEGKKSIELIQAMQVAAIWYRAPKHHHHVAVFQLIELAAGMAKDIGLAGPQFSPSLGYSNHGDGIDTADAWRAWLVGYLLSANMGSCMRRANAKALTEYDENCLQMLGYAHHTQPSDPLICQYVRAERLCERIASELNFSEFSKANDVSDHVTQLTMQGLQNLVTDWKAQIPLGLRCPSLTFWERVAILYIHEPVLHTATNKQSFAAPFITERLSVTDFPAPIATREHVASIHALKDHTHALLDLFSTFDLSTLMSIPSLLFAARIAYADFILVKLYIATTAMGNTLGAFMDPTTLRVEDYLQKMINLSLMIHEVDEKCAPGRILSSAIRMKEFFLNYKLTYSNQPTISGFNDSADLATTLPNFSSTAEDLPFDWNSFAFNNDSFTLGLDEMFADPTLIDWPSEALSNNDSSPVG